MVELNCLNDSDPFYFNGVIGYSRSLEAEERRLASKACLVKLSAASPRVCLDLSVQMPVSFRNSVEMFRWECLLELLCSSELILRMPAGTLGSFLGVFTISRL